MQKMGELVDQQSKSGYIKDIEKKLKIPEKINKKVLNIYATSPSTAA